MHIVDEFYTENDNKYVNISFTKNNNNDATIPLEYNVTKTVPVLENASEYYATVVKFDIPLQSIPITIMPIIPNQANSNLSPLRIGIQDAAGTNFLQNVIYVPQNNFDVPSQLGSLEQVITPYYFIYSYQHMIEMINTALATAFTLSGVAGTAPYFIYTPTTSLFSLIVSSTFNTSPGPRVIFNYPVYQFLDCFNVTGITPGYDINSLYYYNVFGMVNESFGYAPFGNAPVSPPAFFKITQDCENTAGWNPIKKILFLTTALPITFEIVPANNATQDNSGVYSSLNVITDFTPQIQRPSDSKSVAYFAAQGYGGVRLTDMVTNMPLYKIDIKIFWQDFANNLYPMIIPAFSQANVKLGFIRKSLYKKE